ncbi:MAG TPA: UrcA family protein [Caulobacteraceae bacterium]|nr:UrcA family protein [Caulobacteraceae bacterium]
MKTTAPLVASLAIGALGLALSWTPAKAQQPDYYDSYRFGELTVTAPRTPRRFANGGAAERVYASRVVNYRDLDLATPWGRDTLRQRVRWAARSACDELRVRVPNYLAESPGCYADAIRIGMHRADAAIDYQLAER